MINVLLVYPTRMTCELIAAALKAETDINIVGYAQNGQEALAKLTRRECNTLLASIDLPNNCAIQLTRAIRQSPKDVKVLITGLVESNAAILRCLEEGVAGYVLAEDSLADLVRKIRAVHQEEFHLPPAVAYALMGRLAELKELIKEFHTTSMNWSEELFAELTPREWEVVQLIEQGCDNQQIAERLVIEKGTVKNHVHNILSKLDVRSREQAALLARQLFVQQKASSSAAEQNRRFPLVEDARSQYPRFN